MRIAIFGPGSLGTALAKRLRRSGHELRLSYGRDQAVLAATADKLGIEYGEPRETAEWAEVVVIAVPWRAVSALVSLLGELTGKLIWDCTNSLNPDRSALELGTNTSAGEELQKLVPAARVVKAIPTFAELLHGEDARVNGRPTTTFIAGDDAGAKATISGLLAELPMTAVDAGALSASRFIEPMWMLLVLLAYRQGLGAHIGFELVQESTRP
ncbi:MAG: oxidoreductase coenzyme f420-dependent [Myxococcaceae bacterium]|nr:oxidoreductase coenzyme f420-dependent [Myxococcaceae bacterium]